MKRAQGFVLGFGTALGAVALMNARVLGFAAMFERMRDENPGMFDGPTAKLSVEACLAEWERLHA